MKFLTGIARSILSFTNRKSNRENILGDFEEFYRDIYSEHGALRALTWYYRQAIKSIPAFIKTLTYWGIVMIKNYFKIAFRNILRYKGYSFINITGLSLGMVCAILLLLWAHHQQSYDQFHKSADRIFRVEQDQKSPQGIFHIPVTSFPTGPAIKENIPEVKNSCRTSSLGSTLVRSEEKSFYENSVLAVDSSFLQIFSFPFIKGDPNTALNNPRSIILSQNMANKYFADNNAIGQILILNNNFAFTVSGIMEDIPENSSFKPGILIPFSNMVEMAEVPQNWVTHYVKTWVELYNSHQVEIVNKKITRLIADRTIAKGFGGDTPEKIAEYKKSKAPDYMLMPMTDIHLYGYYAYGKVYGTIQSVKVFLTIAFSILLIASINYMNLSTARVANRSKEIGMRKIVGANRKNIMGQFFGESILFAIIAFLFSIGLVILSLPLFNQITGDNFTIKSLFNSEFFTILIAVTFMTGILSGSYPAIFLSSITPIKILNRRIDHNSTGNLFRKSLVIFQFCLSVVLIIGTLIASRQLEYMQKKQVGYEKDHLISIPLRGDTRNSYSKLKEKLLTSANILNVSGLNQRPTNIENTCSNTEWEGKTPGTQSRICFAMVDYDFVETMDIEIVQGRAFSKLISTDAENAILVNEEVLKMMGTSNVIDKPFNTCGLDGRIVGVMKNFHYQSVQSSIDPLAITFTELPRYAVVKLQGNNINTALDNIETVWNNIVPLYPFEYTFVDDDFAKLYKSDEQMRNIFNYAAIMAIIIACLGLFGFASFMAEKRFKEIGIRKILGSSVSQIVMLLNKEFLKWILIANLLAWPIGYFVMKHWLQNFAYRIDISIGTFIVSTLLSLLIALLTVSYQSFKAANTNPVNSLRVE